jgi:uncharacterized membrane protein YkoI
MTMLPTHTPAKPFAQQLAQAAPPAAHLPDQDRARAAVQAGQAMPLKNVLEQLAKDHPGQVLEVELEHEHGRWVYEIKLLQAGGRLVKLELDAATGEVLRRKLREGRPRRAD